MTDKKNCLSCRHLEWVDGDYWEGAEPGFTCNKRIVGGETPAQEAYVLKQLESHKYRRKYKRCFEANLTVNP